MKTYLETTKENNDKRQKAMEKREDLERTLPVLKDFSYTGADLRNISMDGAQFINIDFTGANLCGANLSEALFKNCIFDNACLVDVCFCESVFEDCSFRMSRFAGTDICFAKMKNCRFSGLSAFTLDFIKLEDLQGCIFEHGESVIPFDKAPLVLSGILQTTLALIGDKVIMGQKSFPYTDMIPFLGGMVLKRFGTDITECT